MKKVVSIILKAIRAPLKSAAHGERLSAKSCAQAAVKINLKTGSLRPCFYLILVLSSLFLGGCHRASTQLEPILVPPLHPKELYRESRKAFQKPFNLNHAPFSALTQEELCFEWAKELEIGLYFAADFDLFRAITSFKRALFLISPEFKERKLEIEYYTVLAYYLGKKYTEVIYQVENSELAAVDGAFPAFSDLLLILFDSYTETGQQVQADHIFKLIEQTSPDAAANLQLLQAVKCVDIEKIKTFAGGKRDYLIPLIDNFCCGQKSIRKTEMLNAILPGAGYWYLGQRQAAFTSFLINSLFIAAAAHFFNDGNVGAGLITLSLESGWYFGGIYGGGLSAKLYNERLYETYADKMVCQEKLYPLMMLKYSF